MEFQRLIQNLKNRLYCLSEFFPLSRSSEMISSRLVEGEKFIESNLNKFSLSSTVLVTFWVFLSILSLFYITKPKLLRLSCSEGNIKKDVLFCNYIQFLGYLDPAEDFE